MESLATPNEGAIFLGTAYTFSGRTGLPRRLGGFGGTDGLLPLSGAIRTAVSSVFSSVCSTNEESASAGDDVNVGTTIESQVGIVSDNVGATVESQVGIVSDNVGATVESQVGIGSDNVGATVESQVGIGTSRFVGTT